ncbi:MAG TPA: hypothetical protein VGN13_07145 [Solirubrobacteraceae bacterium]|jgi:hypothetical protein
MGLLRYRPPLVAYRVIKTRKLTAYQAQYLARKSRELGRNPRDQGGEGASWGLEPMRWRALRLLALGGLLVAALIVVAMLALLTWVTILLIEAIL